MRDPRDVLISYYYFQLKKRFIEDGYPMDRYTSRFISGDTDNAYGSWGENVAGWLATRGGSSFSYCALRGHARASLTRTVRKVAAF